MLINMGHTNFQQKSSVSHTKFSKKLMKVIIFI